LIAKIYGKIAPLGILMADKNYFCDIKYLNTDFVKDGFSSGEFENCVFTNCRLADVNLSACVFINCAFINCELSNAKLNDTVFRDAAFRNCKLIGLQFSNCNKLLLSMEFWESQLNLASFYNLNLRKTTFNKCEMRETDFVNADLSGSRFLECDLTKALFENSNLSGCDFLSAYNYTIDPEVNKISKAKFSIFGISGLLGKYDIIIEK
jgi:fluoroquinolone resistance protein